MWCGLRYDVDLLLRNSHCSVRMMEPHEAVLLFDICIFMFATIFMLHHVSFSLPCDEAPLSSDNYEFENVNVPFGYFIFNQNVYLTSLRFEGFERY